MKRLLSLFFVFLLGAGSVFAGTNYTYQMSAAKYNTKEAYDIYANQVNETVYKNMPRSFSYIDSEY